MTPAPAAVTAPAPAPAQRPVPSSLCLVCGRKPRAIGTGGACAECALVADTCDWSGALSWRPS